MAYSQMFSNGKEAQYRDKIVKQAQPKNNSAHFKDSSILTSKDSVLFVISLLDSKSQPQKGHEFVPNNMNHTPSWAPNPFSWDRPREKKSNKLG